MSSPTFGSVGDIITVCLLAKSVVDALDESRGASSEYQGLVSELRSLERSLLEAEVFVRSLPSEESSSLRDEALKLVDECRKTLESFQSTLKKYDACLAEDPSSQKKGVRLDVRRAGMKVKWQLSEKKNVARFRSELSAHCNAINMMLITAQV